MYGKSLSDYPEKFEAFRGALEGLSPGAIDFGFQQAVKNLTEFPTPAQILQFAQEFIGRPEFKALEAPIGKPPGWKPVDPGEVREWMDAALAKLDRVKAMDAPGRSLHEQQRAMALERLGGSTKPTDPAKVPQWHDETARKNGWKE